MQTFKLFSDKPNADLYYEALLKAAKNQKEQAKEIVEAIEKNDSFSIKDKDDDLQSLFDEIFIDSIIDSPESLSYLGLLESIGIYDHNKHLNPISKELILEKFEKNKSFLRQLKKFSLPKNDDEKITYLSLLWDLNHTLKGKKFLYHGFLQTQMFGVLQGQTMVFTLFHRLNRPQDFENYLIRLKKISTQVDELIDYMKFQEEMNIIPPRFSIEKVLCMIDQFLSADPQKNLFYMHLTDKNFPEKEKLLVSVSEVIKNQIYPSYSRLREYFSTLLKKAKEDGVWSLPDGDEYYSYLLKRETTTNLSADEIHEIGLSEVKLIQEKMRELLSKVKIEDEKKTVGELMGFLIEDKKFYYTNNDEGKDQCLKDFDKIIQRSREKLWPLFDLKPKAKVSIHSVPVHEQDGAPAAYYFPPSLDGYRSGAFYVNLKNMDEIQKFEMETLAVHEAEPGHHFQCSIQNESDISIIRKLSQYNAYVEGWALYAEKLAYENDFFSSVYHQLGHFSDELMRAVRLVVDTGIHKKRWSKEKAVNYMSEVLGKPKSAVVSEIERYFVMPAQACSYKIGQLKLLQIRKKLQERLNEDFNIRDFHNLILKTASVPLEILEEISFQSTN